MSSAVLRSMLLAAIVFTLACEDRTPVAPSPSPAARSPALPTPSAMFTLTGTVYESTRDGRRPLAGIPLDISVDYQSWPPRATTDAEGRYRFSASSSEKLNVRAEKEGYSQPCRSAVALIEDSVVDVYMVADATLLANGVPASMPVIQPTLRGTVFERATGSIRPVQGAKVTGDFSAGFGWGPERDDRYRCGWSFSPVRVDGSSRTRTGGPAPRPTEPFRASRYPHDHDARHRTGGTITAREILHHTHHDAHFRHRAREIGGNMACRRYCQRKNFNASKKLIVPHTASTANSGSNGTRPVP